ncbi:MAG: AMP-binding protein, partial [Candidatus Omnitrophota bacterium]
MDFLEVLEKRIKQDPDKAAVVFRDEPITYRQLKDRATQLAAGLSALGIAKADKVAIFLPNNPEYIYSFVGIFILRGIAVPLDFMLTEEEVINFINHSESKVIITQEKKGIDLVNVKKLCPSLKKVILFDAGRPLGLSADWLLPWRELLKNNPSLPKVEARETDHSSIFYTS